MASTTGTVGTPTVVQMPGQQPQTVIQQPSVVLQPRPSAGNRSSNWKGLVLTGYGQVVLGLVSVLLGVVSIVIRSSNFRIGHAIWGGVCFYIVAGIFGIAAGRRKIKSLVVVYLVLAIIAAVGAGVVFIIAAIGIMADFFFCPDSFYSNPYGHGYDFFEQGRCSSSVGSRLAITILILLTGLAELTIAVIGAAFTCSRLCCRKDNSRSVVHYQSAPRVIVAGRQSGAVQYVFATPQQLVPQPGNVMFVGQPVAVAQPQFQPVLQQQGQVPYQPQAPQAPPQYQQAYPQPQGQVQPSAPEMQAQGQGLAAASAPVDGSTKMPAPKASNLPEDHDSKLLII